MIFSLALMEMEIPRHCEARSNLVDCNGQQELQLLKMPEQFAPNERKLFKSDLLFAFEIFERN